MRFRALHWLANQDLARLDPTETSFELLEQRFALAWLYFSTNGWYWQSQVNWLTAYPVCHWENVQCSAGTNIVYGIGLGKMVSCII